MNNVKYYRELFNLSQEGLAEKCNVSRYAISRLERGITSPPSLLYKISAVLNLSIKDLIEERECTIELE